MLRWLLLGAMVYGLGTAFGNGWLEVQWERLLDDAGLNMKFGEPDQSQLERPTLTGRLAPRSVA